ncbi:MAG: Eco57I restriction-modification methylase domain-containing protein [Anaerolineae bacterium]|nr:Eco57I restriction-modification methylase domain-containing protein [Anaerolineae bacterium]
MPIPDSVQERIAQFDLHRAAYHSGQYNEAQVRQEFINPFFDALGWDVYNKQGYSEKYKEVVHEDAIKVQGKSKAPDYAFRLGGQRVFFVEAKKPAVDIKGDISPAYQLRRYAWSAKLPLSILTDFEEFAVYDCRGKPSRSDQASTARVMYLTYRDYAARWDEIAALFSPEAIRKGALDRYVESNKAQRGTAEVDAAFLQEIESWRDALARNIALRNPGLGVRELNRAVQMTIDRLIFLRICEDRGIEPYGRLRDEVSGAPAGQVYERLGFLFRQADDRYNSGLFHFREEKGRAETGQGGSAHDSLTLNLSIDDKTLKPIVANLYYPDCPYEFSVLPPDILGQVYEQFLGKVIRLTAGGRARVEEKPEVKKAGGVYYTPTYIVDTIVAHTLGKLLAGLPRSAGRAARQAWGSPRAAPLRVLDPACGSGTFLLQAYQYLLDWYLEQYVAEGPAPHARQNRLVQRRDGEWALTSEERKRILLDHVYGVDIDPQAVEVTKLSLLLKVLEDGAAGPQQTSFLQERALPDLDRNIRCGNSLIGPDYYHGRQVAMFDEEEMYRVNAFDWKEGFPQAWAAGGFDVVIGNPPYIRSQSLGAQQREYYAKRYASATATYDIYVLFVEKSLQLVNRQGRAGFILPNKFFTTDYGYGLRQILGSGNLIDRIIDFEDAQVFYKAGTYTCLLFLSRIQGQIPEYARLGEAYRRGGQTALVYSLSIPDLNFQTLALTTDGTRWTLAVGPEGELVSRLHRDYPSFAEFGPHIFQGLKTSADKIYMVTVKECQDGLAHVENRLGDSVDLEFELLKPVVKGEAVGRYHIDQSTRLYIVYPYRVSENGKANLIDGKEMATKFPLAWAYLCKYRRELGARDRGEWNTRSDWYAYARSQNIGTFIGPKFMVPYMATSLRAGADINGHLFFVNITTGGYGLRVTIPGHSYKYMLGVINSRLLSFCLALTTNRFRGGYFAVNKQALEQLPIRTIDFNDPADVARHDRMVALVETMLELHKKLNDARTPQASRLLQQQIELTDRQIDALVYELYGLSEEEIAIVESSS